MQFWFILLQSFTHVQEIPLQQNYVGVAYADLRLWSLAYLLTYLPTYLICLSIVTEMLT